MLSSCNQPPPGNRELDPVCRAQYAGPPVAGAPGSATQYCNTHCNTSAGCYSCCDNVAPNPPNAVINQQCDDKCASVWSACVTPGAGRYCTPAPLATQPPGDVALDYELPGRGFFSPVAFTRVDSGEASTAEVLALIPGSVAGLMSGAQYMELVSFIEAVPPTSRGVMRDHLLSLSPQDWDSITLAVEEALPTVESAITAAARTMWRFPFNPSDPAVRRAIFWSWWVAWLENWSGVRGLVLQAHVA